MLQHIQVNNPRCFIVLATCLVILVTLGACAEEPRWPLSERIHPLYPLGNSTATNKAAHIVNPDAPAHANPPEMDGLRAGVAVDRYYRNQVIQPREQEIESVN